MKAFVLPTIFTAVDRFTSPVQKMNRQLRSISQSAQTVSRSTAIMGAAIIAPLALAANEAIKFEDRMADVAKTSGLAGAQLAGLGEDILSMSLGTRTSIEGLQKIAEIGGQMGITGRQNITAFTDSVNKFNVALGSDFQGGVEEAARAIGGLNVLFKETRGLDIADSITKAGSAINALSAKGVQVPEVTEFIKRIGQLPDAIKPSIQDTAALGAVFNKAGITAEIAARGLGDVLLTASQNAPAFAKQMGISTSELQKMLDTNPVEFLKRFSAGLKGMDASKFGPLAKGLKLGDVGSIKVLGSLSSSMEKLTEFQKISNDEFKKGTSLLTEYNVKNETMAAKLARSKNNFEAIGIIIGTELLPIIGDLLKEVMPVIKNFTIWAKQNKSLIQTFAKIALGIATLMGVISLASAIVAAYTKVQILMNLAMLANPIGIIIAAIGLMIGLIIVAIKYYNQWGAALLLFLGPLGWVVNLIMSFRQNWEAIKKAFSEGGIIAGIKMIGATIKDAVLYPLQQVMEIIAQFIGADWAKNIAAGIKLNRESMGLDTTTGGFKGSLENAMNPQQERENSMINKMFESATNRVALDINTNKGTTATVSSNRGGIPIKTKSTHTFGQ